MKKTLSLVLIIVAAYICTPAQDPISGVQLTTVKTPWLLRIAGQELDLTDVKARDERSVYFMMTSDVTKLNVSVFIEPVDKCTTAEACRDLVLGAGNPEWGKYQDLKKSALGAAHYFEFYRPEAKGLPLKVQDMYAEFVKDGYWVDMHISKVQYDPTKDHALFEKVVNSVEFVSKTGSHASPFDATLTKGEAATTSWLGLWDTSKCAESYMAMAAMTRAENTQQSWVDYCNKINGFVGAKSSRNLIGAAFTSSLPPRTDRPLAILAYNTDFAKRAGVVEIVALMFEKDGKWVVTNYFPH